MVSPGEVGESVVKKAQQPPEENIKYRIMTPRTECDSIFRQSLKEISGINDRPLLRTDQKHARTKTVL